MGLDVPDLDDRTFEELFEEAKKQIPVHTDEWSDHNTHDTGIAILELLIWLTETYTYQLDRITDDHREKYLSLLGLQRRPPQPASGQVSVTPPPGADGAVIPAGEPLTVNDRSGVPKYFETDEKTALTEATLQRVITAVGDDFLDVTRENETEGTRFFAFGEHPEPGDTLYFGFDGDPFTADSLTLSIDYYDDDLPEPMVREDTDSFDPSVELRWEYRAATATDRDADWTTLDVVEDETTAFYDGGMVRLDRPEATAEDGDRPPSAETDDSIVETHSELVWIRCRLVADGYEIAPRFASVRTNVLEVTHRQTVTDEDLTRPDNGSQTTIAANQEFHFENQPVLEAEITIDDTRWSEVDHFDTSGPDDTHYVLDHSRGVVRFGDGVNGAKPPIGTTVVAERYTYGGGTAGNVSTRSDWEFTRETEPVTETVDLGDLDIDPLDRTRGGADEESIEEAMERFKRDLKRPYRAVTIDDCKTVATATPGLRFGRAYAATRTKSVVGGTECPELYVVVVPYSLTDRPVPSEAFLAAVRRHLDRNRLLTDQLTVAPPTYVDVSVDITVAGMPDARRETIEPRIRDAICEYVHPLHGFEGDGWPFGRPLYVSEVGDIVEEIGGVNAVLETSFGARGEESIDEYGNVLLPDHALLSIRRPDVSVSVESNTASSGRDR